MTRADSYENKVYEEIKNKVKQLDNERYWENRHNTKAPRGCCPLLENPNKISKLADYWIIQYEDLLYTVL